MTDASVRADVPDVSVNIGAEMPDVTVVVVVGTHNNVSSAANLNIEVSGAGGKDGYTPQRGIDYWTEADKREIREYIEQTASFPAVEDVPNHTDDRIPAGLVLGVGDGLEWELIKAKDMEAVRFVSQTLNVNQQARARKNIGAISLAEAKEVAGVPEFAIDENGDLYVANAQRNAE